MYVHNAEILNRIIGTCCLSDVAVWIVRVIPLSQLYGCKQLYATICVSKYDLKEFTFFHSSRVISVFPCVLCFISLLKMFPSYYCLKCMLAAVSEYAMSNWLEVFVTILVF